ncbi:hypothetical protein UFOVP180_4 [uncultured Caudovirales phage]|uniref:Uncharacterized protein n=1 Tax=uncultured Caudovirales phage TaxID=2100421 RepID=A0A6J7WD93_9CAUD|nr:hypothetical protein UFOVP180_4 [uncultured Caudovirales phage]
MRPDLDPLVLDTKIQGKINAVHRNAFAEKFPGQCEHILRLITERLHAGLDKREGVDLANVDTWRLMPSEMRELAEAMYYINEIRNTLK